MSHLYKNLHHRKFPAMRYKGAYPRDSLSLLSFAVSGEFYFTSLLLGFPRRLVVARKPVFRFTARSEVINLEQFVLVYGLSALISRSVAATKTAQAPAESHVKRMNC